MFEGKPPKASNAKPVEIDLSGGERLRSLSWDDLRTRLDEAHFLRRAGSEADENGGQDASFDAVHARRIAAHLESKDAVNPDDLAKRKGTGRTSEAVEEAPQTGTRGYK